MDSSTEVNRSTAVAGQGKENFRTGAPPRGTGNGSGSGERQQARSPLERDQARVSVDPMRATDRYRLVLPIEAGD